MYLSVTSLNKYAPLLMGWGIPPKSGNPLCLGAKSVRIRVRVCRPSTFTPLHGDGGEPNPKKGREGGRKGGGGKRRREGEERGGGGEGKKQQKQKNSVTDTG